jgi:muconolactone delta-isomerase
LLPVVAAEAANDSSTGLNDDSRTTNVKKRRADMEYFVQMKLAAHTRPSTPQEGITFIEQYIFPTLELCKKMQAEKRILAGGPMSGAIGIAMIVQAESALELDQLIENLPVWPLMETTVTPLTTFDGRMAALRPRLEALRATLKKEAAGGAGCL